MLLYFFFKLPPDEQTRLRLWKRIIKDEKILDKGIQLERLAQEHEITGGTMINVLRYALQKAANPLKKGVAPVNEFYKTIEKMEKSGYKITTENTEKRKSTDSI